MRASTKQARVSFIINRVSRREVTMFFAKSFHCCSLINRTLDAIISWDIFLKTRKRSLNSCCSNVARYNIYNLFNVDGLSIIYNKDIALVTKEDTEHIHQLQRINLLKEIMGPSQINMTHQVTKTLSAVCPNEIMITMAIWK